MKKSIIKTIAAIFFTLSFYAQTDIVKSEGIISPLHQANIGKVTFMSKPIPVGQYNESDFLKSATLTELKDFNLRIFMANSLTNYLHALSPKLTADTLVKNGNFQFSFYVDGLLIYAENLNFGAFGEENKNSRQVFRVALISSTDEDHWGKFMWNRFLMKGGQDAFKEGQHAFKIEIRPYLQTTNLLVGDKIAEGEIQVIVPEIKIPEEQIAIQLIKKSNDWKVSNEKYDENKIRTLNRKIIGNSFKNITSIAVIKDGKLLLEEYFNKANRNSMHDTRSVGKSFTSAMIGIAIKEGYLKNENQQLKDFYQVNNFEHYSTTKDEISIKNLLTMSSAFEGSDSDEKSVGNEENMYPTTNWVNFTLNLPIDNKKINGRQWDYFTAGVVLLGDILNKNLPDGLEKYIAKKLFKPLGIKNYKWQYTPQKNVNTAGGLELSTLDLAKFGQLYKNGGLWNKQQIIQKDWIEKSLSHQQKIPNTENEFYGFLFWNKTYTINNKKYEVYYSSGNGGNKIVIFKDYSIVIVITATAFNTPYAHLQVDNIIQNYLIPSIVK